MRRERRRTLLSSHSSCQVSGEGEQTDTLVALWIYILVMIRGQMHTDLFSFWSFFLSSLTLFSLYEQR